MAVPDWPQSFGTWFPKMVGGVLFEDGHRKIAGTTVFFVLVMALWSAVAEKRHWARLLSWGALAGIVLQAMLGGLTVLLGTWYGWDHTSPQVSTMHASLAQVVFATVVSFTVVTSPGWLEREGKGKPKGKDLVPRSLSHLGVWTLAAIYTQIVMGAFLRHAEAGLIIPDFPLSYGKLVPDFYEWRVGLAFAHRTFAYVVLALVLTLALKVWRKSSESWLRTPALVLGSAVCLQVSLGALSIWTGLKPVVTAFHVLGGALVFSSCIALTLRLFKLSRA
jgi:cytochrome c oxidase assembly protein subunit 15